MSKGLVKKLLSCGTKGFSKWELEKGHIWVNVGIEEPQKIEVDAHYLNHPLFKNLLGVTVEEIGYSYEGALRIVCDIDLFLYLLQLLKNSDASVNYMELQRLVEKFQATRLEKNNSERQFQ